MSRIRGWLRPGDERYAIDEWPKEDFRAHIAYMVGLDTRLSESGELVLAEGRAAVARLTSNLPGRDYLVTQAARLEGASGTGGAV